MGSARVQSPLKNRSRSRETSDKCTKSHDFGYASSERDRPEVGRYAPTGREQEACATARSYLSRDFPSRKPRAGVSTSVPLLAGRRSAEPVAVASSGLALSHSG